MTSSPSDKKILIWATETEISVLVGNRLHRKPVTKEQLLQLAQMFLDKAINNHYKDFEYAKKDFTE